ncbi:MAG: hypothetical protein WBQ95_10155 [Terracidiphilus sp.]
MLLEIRKKESCLPLVVLAFASVAIPASHANAASCLTQSQMTSQQRDTLANEARAMIAMVQGGDIASLRAKTLPAIASDFDGIASSVTSLKPMVQNATITLDEVYSLDASKDQPGAERTQFFCGSPIVVLTFNGIPPAMYALAILHATGVPKPQQISIILAGAAGNQWQLAGFYAKPMVEADHDGLWYWVSARKYAQTKSDWAAWLYYRVAEDLLSPTDFLSSPNLQKLQQEADQARPGDLPGKTPLTLTAQGSTFDLTAIDTTTEFGGLDLDIHYTPSVAEVAQLQTPSTARTQVTSLMAALVQQHPELKQAFHGIWAHADQGNGSLFALELPMDQISPGPQPQAANAPIR